MEKKRARLAGTAFAGVLSWLFLAKTRTFRRPDMEWMRDYDYAHRGLHDREKGIPENSLAAFAAAVEQGYGMELDVHLSRDGRLMVIHDASLERVCGVEGKVEDFTCGQLKALSLCGTEERIPTLEEVLALVDGKTPLIVEIKPEKGNTPLLCLGAAELLDKYPGKFCVESFDPRAVRWFRKNRPAWIRGQLTEYFRRHGNTSIFALEDFFLHHVLGNVAARPDFLAYNTEDRHCLTLRMCRKLFGTLEVDWTVRDYKQYETVKKDGAVVIFEGFRPKGGQR